MNKSNIILATLLASLALSACGSKSAEERIAEQIKDKSHSLTADERPRAQANAKSYYEKEFPVVYSNGTRGNERGVFLECRPSDSNFNGMVTCKGQVPQINGGFKETTRYCGYTPTLVGCSDEDTVK